MKTTKQTKQTTEWDELVQKKFGGNFVKEEDEQRKGTRTMCDEKKEETNAIFDERDDENDEEDEEELEFMKSYREKRIAEMLFMQKEEKEDEKEEKNNNFQRNEYMMHVSHEQWTKEVTEVSRSHPVLVLLTKENSKACYLLERVMEDVALYVSNVADEVSSGGGEGYHSELSGEERADTYFVQERGRG